MNNEMENFTLLFDNVNFITYKFKPEGKKNHKTVHYMPKDFKVYKVNDYPHVIRFTNIDNLICWINTELLTIEFTFCKKGID